jgi:membrane-associated protein
MSALAFSGSWIYVVLFAIIFAETGLVIAPFLPGDSLLFAVGALAGGGFVNVWTMCFTMLVAAILGDTANYWIGRHIGSRAFSKKTSRIFNMAYLERTRGFYERHGGKTIVLARFVPIVRTFAPFVAGVGRMRYDAFLLYNVIGAFVWVFSLTFAGYFFGGLSLVKEHFEYVVVGIVVFSLIPVGVEYLKHKRASKTTRDQSERVTYKDVQKTFKDEQIDNN